MTCRELETTEVETAKIGELIWSPDKKPSKEALEKFLLNTRVSPRLEQDTFALMLCEVGVFNDSKFEAYFQDTKALSHFYNSTCTIEEAFEILSNSDYDVEVAEAKMKEKNLRWSLRKRPLSMSTSSSPFSTVEIWNKNDITDFEIGLNNHNKSFRNIHLYEMGCSEKNLKEIIEFYYVWKKTARYSNWDKASSPGRKGTISDSHPEILSLMPGSKLNSSSRFLNKGRSRGKGHPNRTQGVNHKKRRGR